LNNNNFERIYASWVLNRLGVLACLKGTQKIMLLESFPYEARMEVDEDRAERIALYALGDDCCGGNELPFNLLLVKLSKTFQVSKRPV